MLTPNALRLSVLSAITSTQQRLKLWTKVPPNGLVVYCGEIITSEGKERKINIDFEPFKPINTSLYLWYVDDHGCGETVLIWLVTTNFTRKP